MVELTVVPVRWLRCVIVLFVVNRTVVNCCARRPMILPSSQVHRATHFRQCILYLPPDHIKRGCSLVCESFDFPAFLVDDFCVVILATVLPLHQLDFLFYVFYYNLDLPHSFFVGGPLLLLTFARASTASVTRCEPSRGNLSTTAIPQFLRWLGSICIPAINVTL